MPSLPFLKKKQESESAPAAEPATTEVAATSDAEPTVAVEATPAASETSAAPAVEKTVIEAKRSFFSRKRSTDNGAASESESEGPPSRIPSFFSRKPKPTPTTVKEDDKENVPEAAPEVVPEVAPATVETEAPAPPAEEKKDEAKVRRRISLFQRRNRADGATSEADVTDGEKDAAALKAKRTSFWKTGAPADKEEPKEPAPEDPRLTEAKAKVISATEAETTSKAAFEDAKKTLRDAKLAVKAVEAEIAADLKKAKAAAAAKTEKKDENETAPETAIEPPALPQVAVSA